MKVKLIPQIPVRLDKRVYYTFKEEIIEVELDGERDVFDFTGFPDGRLSVTDPETGQYLIGTTLGTQVIISAEKLDGELRVELLNYISLDATEEECFPDWIDHTEYVAPKVEEKEGEVDG